MSWKKEAEEIERRRSRARQGGGPEAIERQHRRGRLTVRERIEALVDKESFREYGGLAGVAEPGEPGGFTPASVVAGVARIGSRPCVVAGDDFTIRGAAYSPASLKKGLYADELAVQHRIPLVRLLEGGGASVAGASGVRGRSGYDFTSASPLNVLSMQALASVPVVCAALGPVAGFPAARLVASHLSIMTRDTAQVLTGGPTLVERATGEKLSKEALGGAPVHARSGVVDNVAADEADVFRQIRRFLAYLPANVWENPPVLDCDDPAERQEEGLLEIVPRNRRRAYRMRRLIEAVVDRESFFELTPLFGRSQITGLARLAGQPVGVLANDSRFYAGAMTADGAQKVRRFVDLCDTFHLPLVSFVDEPGFMIGSRAERAGTIRHGAAALMAVQQSSVPWASVLVRKAYGVAAAAHFGPEGHVIAWPSAGMGALPVEGGVAVAFRRDIEAAPDPDARRAELEEQLARRGSPFPRAEAFGFHDLIDPRRTRPALCDWIEWIQPMLAEQLGPRRYTYRP